MNSKRNTNFRGVVGLPSDIQSSLLRVELEKAGVCSLLQLSYGEANANISGILVCDSGQTVRFLRYWCYWSVWLTQPLPLEAALALHTKWGSVVRNEGHAASPRPTVTTEHYHVDSQDGLEALVSVIKEQFGPAVSPGPTKQFVDGMQAAKKLDAHVLQPFTTRERADTEMKALLALAALCRRPEERQAILDEAQSAAGLFSTGKQFWTRKVHHERAAFYKVKIETSKARLKSANEQNEKGKVSDRMWLAMEIERDQRTYARILYAIGRGQAAHGRSQAAKEMRPQVIGLLLQHRAELVAEIGDSVHDYCEHRLAFMNFMLGRFYRMTEDAAQSEHFFEQYHLSVGRLTTEHYKLSLESWIQRWQHRRRL